MKTLPENLKGVHLHFVGIKGTGMVALVEIFHHAGAIISGSDVTERFYTDEILEKLNIKPKTFSENNITDDIQYVIYSSAYKIDKTPDLICANKKNIPCLLYTEALGSYSQKSYSCGICGVHGKTSTTGLTGTILKQIDLPVQVLAGSVINSFGNSCTFTSPLINSENKTIFVAETCEYQKHFMSFCPQKIILTSVESDHQDFYPTYESIRDAFVEYILKLPQNGDLIFCSDDKGAVEVSKIIQKKREDINLIPYGFNSKGDFKIEFIKTENEKNYFNISLFSKNGFEPFALSVPGFHEMLDSVAAVALVCALLKQNNKNPIKYYSSIKKGLFEFSGGKRRSEKVGSFTTKNGNNVLVIDDYGHHPTAIKTTLSGYRQFYKNRKIIVDFMSHTYSRTQSLLKEFASSFESCDEVILHKIYSSARENPNDFSITGKTLYEEVIKSGINKENVHYFEEILDAKDFVLQELNKPLPENYKDGYLFVTMGAGDNWKLGKAILL